MHTNKFPHTYHMLALKHELGLGLKQLSLHSTDPSPTNQNQLAQPQKSQIQSNRKLAKSTISFESSQQRTNFSKTLLELKWKSYTSFHCTQFKLHIVKSIHN
jgi:hypothetical protein